MTRNFIDLDDLHKMLTAAGIKHHYTTGDIVLTVIRGNRIWTVSEDSILYWGDGDGVCDERVTLQRRCRQARDFSSTADAYDYLADAYSTVQ